MVVSEWGYGVDIGEVGKVQEVNECGSAADTNLTG